MSKHFTSALLAGVTAAICWLSIALMVGFAPSSAGMWALVFLGVTTLATMIISSVIGRGRPAERTAG